MTDPANRAGRATAQDSTRALALPNGDSSPTIHCPPTAAELREAPWRLYTCYILAHMGVPPDRRPE